MERKIFQHFPHQYSKEYFIYTCKIVLFQLFRICFLKEYHPNRVESHLGQM